MTNGEYGPNLKEGIFRWCPGYHNENPEDHVRDKKEFGKDKRMCKACLQVYRKQRVRLEES
jgi:hypothetical protein